jgi:hypothetical protein
MGLGSYLSVYPASMTTTICMFEIRVKVVAVTQQDARTETCPASFKKLSFPFEKWRGRPNVSLPQSEIFNSTCSRSQPDSHPVQPLALQP